MSLRDYFAAKAMAAMITEPIPHDPEQDTVVNSLTDSVLEVTPETRGGIVSKAYAIAAYMMADAMLAERAK